MCNTFLQIIHKQNCMSGELYNSSIDNMNDFYTTAFKYDFKNSKPENEMLRILLFSFICTFAQNALCSQIASYKTKYIYLDSILKNTLLSDDTKTQFTDAFYVAQRRYFALNRFAHLVKLKKYPTFIESDLYMNPIVETGRNVMTILQDGKKYLFTAKDLINIVETALCNSPGFFSEPLISRNPYTNMPFTKAMLYNIYFFLKDSRLKIPVLIDRFFAANFHLNRFARHNQKMIRYVAIKKYLNNCTETVFVKHTRDMLGRYRKHQIHPDFPNASLVKIMKPFVFMYLLSLHLFDANMRQLARASLNRKLVEFFRENPSFGRKMYKTKELKINDTYFDHSQRKHNSNYFADFETSHLTADDDDDDDEYDLENELFSI